MNLVREYISFEKTGNIKKSLEIGKIALAEKEMEKVLSSFLFDPYLSVYLNADKIIKKCKISIDLYNNKATISFPGSFEGVAMGEILRRLFVNGEYEESGESYIYELIKILDTVNKKIDFHIHSYTPDDHHLYYRFYFEDKK